MFAGIIQKMGILKQCGHHDEGARLSLEVIPWEEPLQEGESIALNGVCLTLASASESTLVFDLLTETLQRTNLSGVEPGGRINLERPLKAGDPIGGHFLSGHVDGVGEVTSLSKERGDWCLRVACSSGFTGGMVPKGSIACNGVSLTIVDLEETSFSVHLVPFTMENTTFGDAKAGDRVNLELDMMGKYVRKYLDSRGGAD